MMRLSAAPPFARLLNCLVDNQVGVLASVTEMRTEAGAPDFFHFTARLSDTEAFSRRANCGRVSAASVDREAAVTSVIIDAISHYCSALRTEEGELLPVCSAKAAPFPCVPPGEFSLFSPKQYEREGFPWIPFTEDMPVHWAQALDPLRDETMFVPSAMAFLPYAPRPEHGEAPIAPPTSIGLACHWNPAQACVDAICDVIECDALAIVWQAQLAMPQIRIETLSDANYDLVSRFERTGSSISLLKVELEFGVSTFLACLSNASPTAPARIFAAGTDLDPERGIRKSLEKLAHVQYYCQLIHTHLPRPGSDRAGIVEQRDHLNFWCDHRNSSLVEPLFTCDERLEFDELVNLSTGKPERDLVELLQRTEASGYRALVADLTAPDVAVLGLTVVRAVIPGLHPLFFGYEMRALGGWRLRQIPQKLGYPGLMSESGDFPYPHPFSRKGVVS
jgi:ribosomal protein S12 methylthiotransferase accessory factor